MQESNRSKLGKLGSFLFFWTASFLVVIGLVALTLKFMGMPVGQTFLSLGNQIPVINEMLPDANSLYVQAEEVDELDDEDYWKEEFEKREAELQEKSQQIAELKEQLTMSQNGNKDLQSDISDLESQLETKQTESVQEQMKQLAEVYETMSTSKAAALFEVMPLEEATVTIMLLDTEQQSGILGGMKNKKKAAEISMTMKDAALLPNTSQMPFDEKIKELVRANQSSVAAISETISKMPTAQSAIIIQSMMETNKKVAMDIMKDVTADIRSQILAVMAKDDATLAAQITADLN